jgi:hypothetical protein
MGLRKADFMVVGRSMASWALEHRGVTVIFKLLISTPVLTSLSLHPVVVGNYLDL